MNIFAWLGRRAVTECHIILNRRVTDSHTQHRSTTTQISIPVGRGGTDSVPALARDVGDASLNLARTFV